MRSNKLNSFNHIKISRMISRQLNWPLHPWKGNVYHL